MNEPWTIARVLDWTRKDFAGRTFASPRLDAELLIAHALRLARVELYTRFDQPLSEPELAAVRALVERRRKHEPVAYILGEREFYGRPFHVDRRVLIPRPETETIVEAALAALPPAEEGRTVRVADIGTGSGILAVTIALERPDARIDAIDASNGALDLARANVARHGVADRVTLHEGSLYEPVGDSRFDLVVSNPPYIPTAEIETLMPDVRDFEPRMALDGGANGTAVLEPLVREGRAHLVPRGVLVSELGDGQGAVARAMAERAGYVEIALRQDLAGIERALIARAP